MYYNLKHKKNKKSYTQYDFWIKKTSPSEAKMFGFLAQFLIWPKKGSGGFKELHALLSSAVPRIHQFVS